MSLGVLRENENIIFACSPNTLKNTFDVFPYCVIGDDSVLNKKPSTRRIYHLRVNTFRIFSAYAERIKNVKK
jgi:hypothetical protein